MIDKIFQSLITGVFQWGVTEGASEMKKGKSVSGKTGGLLLLIGGLLFILGGGFAAAFQTEEGTMTVLAVVIFIIGAYLKTISVNQHEQK